MPPADPAALVTICADECNTIESMRRGFLLSSLYCRRCCVSKCEIQVSVPNKALNPWISFKLVVSWFKYKSTAAHRHQWHEWNPLLVHCNLMATVLGLGGHCQTAGSDSTSPELWLTEADSCSTPLGAHKQESENRVQRGNHTYLL